MKRIICIFLVVSLVLTSTLAVFAMQERSEEVFINLNMTTSQQDIDFLKESFGTSKLQLEAEKNNIAITITDISKTAGKAIIDGTIQAKVYGEIYGFEFSNQVLRIKQIGEEYLYCGIIESNNKTHECFLDVTTNETFNHTVANLTLINLSTGNEEIMFYGDTFDEQIILYNEEKELAKKAEQNDALINEENSLDDESILLASSGDDLEYKHVSNKSNKISGGVEQEKQMMVMSISKYTPSTASIDGRSRIRLFTRSYNVKNALNLSDGIVLPYKMYVKFTGDSGEVFGPFTTIPSVNNETTFNISDIYSVLCKNTAGQRVVVAIDLIVNKVVGSLMSKVTNNGTTTEFNLYIDTVGNSTMDLPAATVSNDAEFNQRNGLVVKIKYGLDDLDMEKELNVSANITYRIFNDNDRTFTRKTGTATYNYSI